MADSEADAASLRSRLWKWLLDHLRLPALSSLFAASVFAAHVVGIWFAVVSLTRLLALLGAPLARSDEFRWDRSWRKAVAVQAAAVGLADVLRRMALLTESESAGPPAAVGVVVFLVAGLLCVIAHVESNEYVKPHGGLLAAYRLRAPAQRAFNLLRPPSARTWDLDEIAATTFRVCALTVVLGIFANVGYAQVKDLNRDEHKPETRRPPPGSSAESAPQPAEIPPGNPFADEHCGFNVYDKIAHRIPPKVAVALAVAYGGTREEPDRDAPGAQIVGCPMDGTVQAGAVYVAWLTDPATRAPMGALVGTETGAAVVYPTLRRSAERLVKAGLVTGVERRVRTRFGDTQVFRLVGAECVVVIREYNHEYVELPAVITAAFVRLAVARGEVPRVATRAASAGRVEYVLTFSARPSTVVVTYDPVLQVAVTGAASNQLTSGNRTCPDIRPFYDLAASAAPPRPDETP